MDARHLAVAGGAAIVLTAVVIGPPTVAGHPAPAYVACDQEDGSTPGQAFPCYWDAAHRGNGVGQAYVLRLPVCSPDQVAASDAAHRAGRPSPIADVCDDVVDEVAH